MDKAYAKSSKDVSCARSLALTALSDIPIIQPGDDLPELLLTALARGRLGLETGDVLVITSKIVSRAEGRFVDLRSVDVSERARELAQRTGKEPELVELMLRESTEVSRVASNTLLVRHRLGMVLANAGIDRSNVGAHPDAHRDGGAAPDDNIVLLLPTHPDASAQRIRDVLVEKSGAQVGVVISDSHGRPFRLGAVGTAIGVAGMPALWDHRGRVDLFGRTLRESVTCLGDQLAAAAALVSGESNESRPVVHIRGLSFPAYPGAAADLVRDVEKDLFR